MIQPNFNSDQIANNLIKTLCDVSFSDVLKNIVISCERTHIVNKLILYISIAINIYIASNVYILTKNYKILNRLTC